MANRRMLSKSISVCPEVNSVSLAARVLFMVVITHADDFGYFEANNAKMKALMFPLSVEHTISVIDNCLSELANTKDEDGVPLLYLYKKGEKRYGYLPKWEEHQGNLHNRTSSKFPEFPGDSQIFPEVTVNYESTKLNLNQLNLNQINQTEPLAASSDDLIDSDLLRKRERIKDNVLLKQPLMRADIIHNEMDLLFSQYPDIDECLDASNIMAVQEKHIVSPFSYIKTTIDNQRKIAVKPKDPQEEMYEDIKREMAEALK